MLWVLRKLIRAKGICPLPYTPVTPPPPPPPTSSASIFSLCVNVCRVNYIHYHSRNTLTKHLHRPLPPLHTKRSPPPPPPPNNRSLTDLDKYSADEQMTLSLPVPCPQTRSVLPVQPRPGGAEDKWQGAIYSQRRINRHDAPLWGRPGREREHRGNTPSPANHLSPRPAPSPSPPPPTLTGQSRMQSSPPSTPPH